MLLQHLKRVSISNDEIMAIITAKLANDVTEFHLILQYEAATVSSPRFKHRNYGGYRALVI